MHETSKNGHALEKIFQKIVFIKVYSVKDYQWFTLQ